MNKKSVTFALTLLTLLVIFTPIVSAQTYSGFDRFADDFWLFFSNGDTKVKLALEIREKEVNSALENIENGDTEKAIENLEKAEEKLLIIQKKVSLQTSEEVKTSTEKIKEKTNNKNLPEEFKEYTFEEEKTRLTAELILKNFEYCKTLAEEDYTLMLREKQCNPETAPKGMENELEELKQLHEKYFNKFMLDIRSCINDPGTCNCSDNVEAVQKAKCEKMVTLAIKCEYKDEKTACNELESMKPKEGDGFAESFFPDFLWGKFEEKKENVIEYNIEKSDVPPECYNENEKVKTQCAAFRDKKEISEKCWDEKGNFLVDECGGPEKSTPTMQESIPQCYDEQDNFLEEKCGKITIIWNDEGLINYIIEKEVDKIVDKLENNLEEHKIDVNGKEGQTLANEIKNEIKGIEGQIQQRTFASGTGGNGEINSEELKPVIETDTSNENDGLQPEIKTGTANGDDGLKPVIEISEGNGDDGLKPEIKTYSPGDGTQQNEIKEENQNEVQIDNSTTTIEQINTVDSANTIDP